MDPDALRFEKVATLDIGKSEYLPSLLLRSFTYDNCDMSVGAVFPVGSMAAHHLASSTP